VKLRILIQGGGSLEGTITRRGNSTLDECLNPQENQKKNILGGNWKEKKAVFGSRREI